MSLPRQVLPQTTYLLTRRTAQRQFLLKPTAVSKQVILYCFHRAARIYGVQIHALQVLDNHFHAVVTVVLHDEEVFSTCRAAPRARHVAARGALPPRSRRSSSTELSTEYLGQAQRFYFNQDNPQWPATATLRLTMPPLSMSDALVRDGVATELERLETKAHVAAQKQGTRFLGPQKVLEGPLLI